MRVRDFYGVVEVGAGVFGKQVRRNRTGFLGGLLVHRLIWKPDQLQLHTYPTRKLTLQRHRSSLPKKFKDYSSWASSPDVTIFVLTGPSAVLKRKTKTEKRTSE